MRNIEIRENEFSDSKMAPVVVLLSNFEAIRSNRANSRVGSSFLVRELKSGTGTSARSEGASLDSIRPESGLFVPRVIESPNIICLFFYYP